MPCRGETSTLENESRDLRTEFSEVMRDRQMLLSLKEDERLSKKYKTTFFAEREFLEALERWST